jgi:hypothetical protein
MGNSSATAPSYGDARLPERFWEKVTVTDQGCWQWTGTLSKGYGRFHPGGRRRVGYGMSRAHRLAYAALIGPIGEGMSLDHDCHTRDESCPGGLPCLHRRCVNPAHLEPVTNTENQRRSPNTLASLSAAKTHCPQGHPYDAENTLVFASEGKRRCRTCRDARRAVKTPTAA